MVKKQPAKPSTSKPKPKAIKPPPPPNDGKRRDQGHDASPPPPPTMTNAHQQKLLDIFQSTFHAALSSPTLPAVLQHVKAALFRRDFDEAFGSGEPYLDAYAARWSPTRALCYASVLARLEPYLLARDDDDDDGVGPTPASASSSPPRTLKVLVIGGAAAEAVACASFLSQQHQQQQQLSGDITLLDIAPWAPVVEKLRVGLTTPPALSKYASAAAHATNTALVTCPDQLSNMAFRQHDVLALDKADWASLLATTCRPPSVVLLVTLLFTLNELFTAGGVGKTTASLLTLTAVLPPGALLLVIDSPGSYSEATVGGQEAKRRYPMHWLLDKILLGRGEDDDDAAVAWEKVESADSVWFRLGPELRYPIPLEDMRYQMHLYRRRRGGGAEGVGSSGG